MAKLPPIKKEEQKIRVVLRNKEQPKQIVTSETSKDKKKDPKAKFLSKNDQSFKKQMTARTTGAFKEAGKGKKDGKKATPVKEVKEQKVAKANRKIIQKAIKKEKGKNSKNKTINMADLAMGFDANAPKKQRERKVAQKSSNLGLKSGNSKKTGLSANNDFVEDIPLGDMTRLNTVEYKYYGFYHRIKQKLEQYWGNSIKKKATALWKSGRRIPASENKITSLEITLDSAGNIVSINVKGSSGVRELDDAAVESFNKAGPFPNPPKGLVKNGTAKIEWGFVVKS